MRRLAWLGLVVLGCGGTISQPTREPRANGTPPDAGTPMVTQDYGRLDLLAGLEHETLDNGMKVFVKREARLPVAAVVTVYRVGSVHEPEGTSGLAHFLEHMLFKGTDVYAKGEIDRITVRGGGQNNAFTENDYTLYWFNVASDALDDALKIEASRMRNSLLDPKEFDEERNVVTEELYRLLDGPSGQLQYEIDQLVFRKHSYRRPGWGFEKDLETVKHGVMRDFYLKHYGPNNAALIVVGDVDSAKTFARVRELFSKIPKVSAAEPPTPPEPAQAEERRHTLQTDKSLDRLGLAWRTAKAGSDEDYVLDVVQMLLSHGKDSRLFKRLILKDRSAYSADAWNNSRRYDGVFYVFAEAGEGKTAAEIEKAVIEEIDLLKTKPVGARELQKAKNLLTANFIFGKESPRELATAIGTSEGLAVPTYLRDYLAKVNAVTPEKIGQVAAAVFRPENRTVAVAKAKHERAVRLGQSATGEFGEYHEHRLANGLTLLVKPRRGLPVVSVAAYVDAGALNEPADKAGVAALTGALLDQGFQAPDGRMKSGVEIAESIEFTGAQLSTSPTGLSIKALTRDLPMALDSARDMLLHPTFPQDKLEIYRGQQLDAISAVGDSPSDLARETWYREVFAGHPLERPAHGLAATVEKLSRADVVAHHAAFYRPDNTIIAVAGDVDVDAVRRELEKRFGGWTAKEPTVRPVHAAPERQDKPRQVIDFRKSKQVNLCFGHVSLPHTDPDFFAMRVFEQVFCSSPAFTDRLSRIVREELHLAYELWGTVTLLERHPGPFLVFIGSGAKNGLLARDETLKILAELLKDGPTQDELDVAKGYLTRSIPFRWESSDELAQYMITCRRLRLGIDWPLRYRAAIAAVTREQVMQAARRHVNPEAMTTVIVGPVDKSGKVIEDEK